jgi:hypothetical protein
MSKTANDTDVTIIIESDGHISEVRSSCPFSFHVAGPATSVASAMINLCRGRQSGRKVQEMREEPSTLHDKSDNNASSTGDSNGPESTTTSTNTAIIELFEYPRHHDTTRHRHSPTARTASRTQQETRTTRRADLAYMQPTTPLQQHRTCGSSSERAHYN